METTVTAGAYGRAQPEGTVAVATIVVAYAAHAGLELNEELVTTILGVGVALILGIAHEDAGRAGTGRG